MRKSLETLHHRNHFISRWNFPADELLRIFAVFFSPLFLALNCWVHGLEDQNWNKWSCILHKLHTVLQVEVTNLVLDSTMYCILPFLLHIKIFTPDKQMKPNILFDKETGWI